jgi:hypothetical protein
MEDILKKWLFDPTVGKIVFSIAAILFTLAAVRFAQRILARYVQNTERRYRLKKNHWYFGLYTGHVSDLYYLQ